MGDLHAGELSSLRSSSSLLCNQFIRHGAKQDSIECKRSSTWYLFHHSALGKLNFWTESIHQIYSGKKPQPQPISIALHHAIHNNPLTNGYFHRMIKVRGKQVSNRSISSISEMRIMADDSKGTILALTLELLRIQITNDHMREAISYLGQAVRFFRSRQESASI